MEQQIAVTLWDDGRQHDLVFIQMTSRCVRSVCRSFLQTHTEGDKLSHTPWCEMSPGKAQPTGKSSIECHRDTQSKLLKQCGEEMAVTFTVCVCLPDSASVHAETCLFESVCCCEGKQREWVLPQHESFSHPHLQEDERNIKKLHATVWDAKQHGGFEELCILLPDTKLDVKSVS